MKRYFSSKNKREKYFLAFGDFLIISLSLIITFIINFTFFTRRSYGLIFDRMVPWGEILAILYIFIFYIADLYVIEQTKNLSRYIITLSLSILLVSLIGSGILFFFPKYIIGRKVIIINIPIAIGLLILWRFTFIKIILKKRKPYKLALVGSSRIISNFIDEFSKLEMKRYIITQINIIGKKRINKSLLHESITIFKNISDLLENPDFDTLAFDYAQGELSDQEIQRILQLKFQGKSIYDFPSFFEQLIGKVPLNCIDSNWFLSKRDLQGNVSKLYIRIKRLSDLLLSAVLLIITFPLGMIIAFAIKLTSKGSIFFKQKRFGLGKQSFICYKFRSMRMEAEKKTGPVWSTKNDSRLTHLGKILRKTRLDELPQLWNILKGDMSFVGNRPIRKYFADRLSKIIPFYDLRFLIKPGLTGWAQINHGYSGSNEEQFEKFQYELFYIKNMSFFLDVYIIFKTIKTVARGKGE